MQITWDKNHSADIRRRTIAIGDVQSKLRLKVVSR